MISSKTGCVGNCVAFFYANLYEGGERIEDES